MYKGVSMASIEIDIGGDGIALAEMPSHIEIGQTYEIKSTDNTSVLLVVKACIITPEKLYRDAEWLSNAYTVQNKTMAELGTMFNVSPMTICTWLDKFGIDTRSRGRRS